MKIIQYDKNGFPSLYVDEETGTIWERIKKEKESARTIKIRKKEFEKVLDRFCGK